MQKKYRWLLGILLVSLLYGGFYYFFIYFPIYIEFTAQEKSNFGWSQKDQERFYCTSIKPIRGTPYIFYIFCRFYYHDFWSLSGAKNSFQSKTYRGFLIDSTKAVSVLKGEWNSKEYLEYGIMIEGESWFHDQSFAINGKPILQFLHKNNHNSILMYLPFISNQVVRGKTLIHELLYVDISGNMEIKKGIPRYFFPITEDNKIVIPTSYNGISYEGLKEYTFSEDKQILLNEWKGVKNFYSFITLDNGCYCGFDTTVKQEIYFYIPGKPPKTDIFPLGNLRSILPDLVTTKHLSIVSCYQRYQRYGLSPLFFVDDGKWDRCPVFKIISNRVKDGEFQDIFKFCGSVPKEKGHWNTLVAMNNDQVIISFSPEYDQKKGQYNFDSPSFDIYKPSIIEDGDKNRFCEKIKTVEIPFKVDSREISTLDDQYILFYGEGAIWKMKWDGSEYAKIFHR
jgi:hypothetical protein